ncbi:uncharacterized protein LAESUDRAFT_647422 [Laetiporus sulphureus 93-53]|uniref:BZIP domain-containing protein n=1 Tax=Laetiporus sulphureus 93-53 TaxID=1314785 RepID=A0A165FLU7_9APHY|nr:uncharacterized protein LAESUDRAFT_647422 [Laetiporus sulphureus 93-53]KZT09165.1 hypothetical protein LAESUDRAFT_647422 [Laetiporus sulphureus 93-53]
MTDQSFPAAPTASPVFDMMNDFTSEYLTSPYDDSPLDEWLSTPALDSADIGSDILTSPAIADTDDFNDFGGTSLFGESLGLTNAICDQTKVAPRPAPVGPLPTPFDFNDMYRMPSPTTPALDPMSLDRSPHLSNVAPPAPPRRRNAPTGTRKNITPEALVPLDAPIQPRKYVTPSATSRKEVPAVFAKKRSLSVAFGEDGEQVDAANLPLSDLEAIEAKRRQNTLAARRSRKRKLEYQRELEVSMEQERAEKEMWKSRAIMYEALLHSHGLEVPSFDP